MKLQVDVSVLEPAVKTVAKILGTGVTGLTSFSLVDGKLVVAGVNQGTGVSLGIPCKVLEKSSKKRWAINPSSFLSAIANRKILDIEVNSGTIVISSNRYKAELVTSTLDEAVIIPEKIKKKNPISISGDLVEFIRKELSNIELDPVLDLVSYMPVLISSTKKGTLLCCYDNWHMAYARSKRVKGNVQFVLPVTSLSLITKEFRGLEVKLHMTQATLYAYSKTFELALSLPQQESQNVIPVDKVLEMIQSFKELKTKHMKISVADLKDVTSNMSSINKAGGRITFAVNDNKCRVALKSTHGKIESTVKCSSKHSFEFKTGFGYFKDILNKLSGDMADMDVTPGKLLSVTHKNKTFTLGLID